MRLLALDRFTWRRIYWILLVFLVILITVWWQPNRTFPTGGSLARDSANPQQVKGAIQPIPLSVDLDVEKVALGEELFRDKRLSADNQVSCLSCHHFKRGGADRQTYSVGSGGVPGDINALTVFNAGFNFRFNWNGAYETLEDQIQATLQNPKAMGSQWNEVVEELQATPEYPKLFARAYADGLTAENIKDAIATYIKSLYTPNSRFDQYLKGDEQALTPDEKAGYQLFQDYGCISCHQGMNIGGNMFQRFGVIGDYFDPKDGITQADLGYYNVTKDEADRYVFRVPSLRNVALTAPYMHNGSVETLEEMVKIVAKAQLGRTLSEGDTDLIVQFLKTLTGEYLGGSLEKLALDSDDDITS
ncbi:MAG: cytochrome c peroxidase [Leptolyngbyaceae cyanobacterium MO_188.B28]|nr:cytochrome c peroxidase [Leptolyngbyaceae cyanobacterium MO_188.B28]